MFLLNSEQLIASLKMVGKYKTETTYHLVRGLDRGRMHPSHIPATMLVLDFPCKY